MAAFANYCPSFTILDYPPSTYITGTVSQTVTVSQQYIGMWSHLDPVPQPLPHEKKLSAREAKLKKARERSKRALLEALEEQKDERPCPSPKARYKRPRVKGRTAAGSSRYRTLIC